MDLLQLEKGRLLMEHLSRKKMESWYIHQLQMQIPEVSWIFLLTKEQMS